ncbi:MAG: hypothetical protein IJ493_07865 [Clostridia bacterium]|nr:hypothetical protein [Clostridia bacterium]
MPYINVKVSTHLTDEQEQALKAGLGQAITAIPGKSETYLMVCIEDDAHLWLGGKDAEPHAMIDVKILGHAKPADFDRMTGQLCQLMEKQLSIKPSNVYVTYAEVENWGWNGSNF